MKTAPVRNHPGHPDHWAPKFAGEVDPNSEHGVYGLVRYSGAFHRSREVVARFQSKEKAEAAAQKMNDARTDIDYERFLVAPLGM
jgi:hypothetical protein